uniref:Uncharacterized protein n=1 Tax=Physcomitrium patens TaxID=3218 RepID=A0A2K1K601_PHYPA|nr:hypothetical protein PHYPA_011107 [Physcomitrium patens]
MSNCTSTSFKLSNFLSISLDRSLYSCFSTCLRSSTAPAELSTEPQPPHGFGDDKHTKKSDVSISGKPNQDSAVSTSLDGFEAETITPQEQVEVRGAVTI